VPKDANLFLVVGYAAAENPTLLTALGPDFFTALKFYEVDPDESKLAAVGELTGLRGLDLRETDASDETMKSIAKLKKLELLNLSHTTVTDAGMAYLTSLQSLKVLVLDATDVGDNSLKYIQKLPHLRELSLTHTHVTDKGLHALAGMPELETLWLGEEKNITATGLLQLAPMKNLTFLGLQRTAVTGDDLAIFRTLIKQIPSIKFISLIGNSFTDTVMKRWQKSLPGVQIQGALSKGNDRSIPASEARKLFAPLHSWSGR
jgi:hypothetical protein